MGLFGGVVVSDNFEHRRLWTLALVGSAPFAQNTRPISITISFVKGGKRFEEHFGSSLLKILMIFFITIQKMRHTIDGVVEHNKLRGRILQVLITTGKNIISEKICPSETLAAPD